MIKYRNLTLYAIIAALSLFLIHSVSVVHNEKYAESLERLTKGASGPFAKPGVPQQEGAAPNDFQSIAVPIVATKAAESEVEKLEKQKAEEVARLRLEAEELRKQAEQFKAEAENIKNEEAKKAQQGEAREKQLKEQAVEEHAKTKQAADQKAAADNKARIEKLRMDVRERKDYQPLYKKYLANTVDTTGMTVAQRRKDRHRRYVAYMEERNKLNERDLYTESWELEQLKYKCEWKELEAFKEDIKWNENEYVNGSIQPAKDKVLILSANDGRGNTQIGGGFEASLENRKEYCNYHGCIDYFVNLKKFVKPGDFAVWSKMAAIREAFETHPDVEWVWWLDTDAIIMNGMIDVAKHILNPRALKERLSYGRPLHSMKEGLFDFIYFEEDEIDPNDIDLIIAQDFFSLNAGSFFIRRSAFTEFLLEFWEDPFHHTNGYIRAEQDALCYMFLGHERFQNHFGLVSQRLLNSYTYDPKGVWTYDTGDLIVHLAGCNEKKVCESHFHEFWAKRIQVPEEFRVANPINITAMKKGL